jgi:hypothetical protein
MKNISFDKAITFIALLFSVILTCPSLAENTDNSSTITWLVLIHNDNEYFWPFMSTNADDDEIVPVELRSYIQSGDSIGYKCYDVDNIIEEVTGTITKSKKAILSNGIEFLVDNLTIFEALRKLVSIYSMLHTANYGYYPQTSRILIHQNIQNFKIGPSIIKWSAGKIIVLPPEKHPLINN